MPGSNDKTTADCRPCRRTSPTLAIVLAVVALAACAPLDGAAPGAPAANQPVAAENLAAPVPLAPNMTGGPAPAAAAPPMAPPAAAMPTASPPPPPAPVPVAAPVAPPPAPPAGEPPPPGAAPCPPGTIGMLSPPDVVGTRIYICRNLNPPR